MNPGEFRYRVGIVVITEAQQSDYGDFTQSDSNSYTRYAKIKWLPGSEKIEAETITLEKNIEFIFRFGNVTQLLDRIDYLVYNSDKYYPNSIQFKGYANQQYVVIKANTFTD